MNKNQLLEYIKNRIDITAKKVTEYKNSVPDLAEWFEGQNVVYCEIEEIIEVSL